MLQSTAIGTAQGRYDLLLGADPEYLELCEDGVLRGNAPSAGTAFLDALDDWWRAETDPVVHASELPFVGGWFVYLGYELAAEIEPTLRLPKAADNQPVALAVRCPAALIRDHALAETWAVAEPGRDDWIARILRDCQSSPAFPMRTPSPVTSLEEEPAGIYESFVRRIREYVSRRRRVPGQCLSAMARANQRHGYRRCTPVSENAIRRPSQVSCGGETVR